MAQKARSLPQTHDCNRHRAIVRSMSGHCRVIWRGLIGLLRSRAALKAEILVVRHQLNILRRKSPNRLAFSNIDRLV
jgi:hypothetical protein